MTAINKMPNLQIFSMKLAAAALLLMLAACASRNPAPVSDARPPLDMKTPAAPPGSAQSPTTPPVMLAPKPADPSKVYIIQRGDTVFSIAKQYGLDYRELAAWNNIVNPTAIRVGDTLRLTRPDTGGAVAIVSDNINQSTPSSNSTMPLIPGEVTTTPLLVTPPVAAEKPLINSATLKVEPKASKVPYSDQAYAKVLADSNASALSSTAIPSPNFGAVVGNLATPSISLIPPLPPASQAAVAVMPAIANLSPQAPIAADSLVWAWPVKGKITTNFTETTKGIDIVGTRGKAILAAAAGKVIYSEAGLRGYGRMIIIKHNEQWLSAYAHNDKILVQKDQEIKQGQKIAEMGSSDTDTVKLHFEIRKLGKPVDPMKYLPAQ
jgi:lipoprotein NlpD